MAVEADPVACAFLSRSLLLFLSLYLPSSLSLCAVRTGQQVRQRRGTLDSESSSRCTIGVTKVLTVDNGTPAARDSSPDFHRSHCERYYPAQSALRRNFRRAFRAECFFKMLCSRFDKFVSRKLLGITMTIIFLCCFHGSAALDSRLSVETLNMCKHSRCVAS